MSCIPHFQLPFNPFNSGYHRFFRALPSRMISRTAYSLVHFFSVTSLHKLRKNGIASQWIWRRPREFTMALKDFSDRCLRNLRHIAPDLSSYISSSLPLQFCSSPITAHTSTNQSSVITTSHNTLQSIQNLLNLRQLRACPLPRPRISRLTAVRSMAEDCCQFCWICSHRMHHLGSMLLFPHQRVIQPV